MPRENESRNRLSNTISPDKVYIIATEGETEQCYFDAIDLNGIQHKIDIELVPKVDETGIKITNSDPKHTFKYLKLYDKENNVRRHKFKELWLLCDRDRWGAQIDEIYKLCVDHKYFFTLSNPCFEIWLLLHKKSIDDFTNDEQNLLFANPRVNNEWKPKAGAKRTYIEKHLGVICGQYSKSSLRASDYLPYINDAITRAEALHIDKNEKYPTGLGSHVYILVKKILQL